MPFFTEHLNRDLFFPVVWSAAGGVREDIMRDKGIIIKPSLEEAVRRFAPDIVHIHRAGWTQPELILPVAASFREDAQGKTERLPRIVETNIFGRSDHSESGKLIDVSLFVSNFCAGLLRAVEHLKIEPPRYQVLYNPVDTDFFASACPAPETRNYSRPVFGRISRADPASGP